MDEQLTAYKKTEILGKSPLELVIKVYDGAIDAFRGARDAYEQQDNEAGFARLQKARQFVTHLYTTLDMEGGGEIAEQLSRLYVFVLNQTSVIEATKDLGQIDDNINILDNLRQGWMGLKEEQNKSNNRGEPETNRSEASLTTTA